MRKPDKALKQREDPGVDLNEIVAYNFRAARELRGWTQMEAAQHLEDLLGQRLPQASISAIERAYEADRRREFDAHELLAFALAFELPLVWFLLPPPGDHRRFRKTSSQVDELWGILFGRGEARSALYARLKQLGYNDPSEADLAFERLSGKPSPAREESYAELQREMLLALVDREATRVDKLAEELGAFFDRLRLIGIRGLISERLEPDPVAAEVRTAPEARKAGARSTAD